MKPPLFICGSGRSGTTLFFHMMISHPGVSWFTTLVERFPTRPTWNRLAMHAAGTGPGEWVARHRLSASEAYRYWDRLYPGFSQPLRDLVADDVTVKAGSAIRDAVAGTTTPARPHFMAKITGWPRIGFLQAALPEARFVRLRRDGRAVANSLLTMPFWRGWQGPSNWRWGALSPEYEAVWEAHDRSFVALAGIQWLIITDAFEAAIEAARPGSVLELDYGALCRDPIGEMERVADFADMEMVPAFRERIRAVEIREARDKWRTQLTPAQQQTLESVLGERLARYGYT